VVKYIRDLKPDVVLTFDPIGGYKHPDHIHIHKATVFAFANSDNASFYPRLATLSSRRHFTFKFSRKDC